MNKDIKFKGANHQYLTESILGRGAMGVVYKGISQDSNESVAIKTLRPDLLFGSERQSVVDRFKREASISMDMKHPNIVKVLDSGQEDESIFLAMELIQGKELQDLLSRPDSIPLDVVIKIIIQLLDALEHAHRKGVVHRDIKPGNIMVQEDYSIKVTDFGIAHIESSEMTNAGTLLGTPAFMAPEQIMGGVVDGRADIFAAGIVLYQLLTGVKPFTGQLTTIMYKILNETPPLPSKQNVRVPAVLDDVVMKAIAKNPDERFSNAAKFSKALLSAWEQARMELTTVDENATIIQTSSTVVSMPETVRPEVDALKHLNKLGKKTEELLQQSIENVITQKHLGELNKSFIEYVDLLKGDAGKDPELAGLIKKDRDQFDDIALGKLKDLIISEAPMPGKKASPDDRNDWMLCIDLFLLLGKTIIELGGQDKVSDLSITVRSELLTSALMYADHINQLLASPDDLELILISADFMRLDILQWGMEELGGDDELRQMHNSIRMFSGQVLQKVNTSIRDFIQNQEIFARVDVANLLLYIDELLVIAARIIEIPPVTDETPSRQEALERETVTGFIDNAGELAKIFVAELKDEVTHPDIDTAAFQSKLKQLGRLYQFSVLFDDESCRSKLHKITEEIHSSFEEMSEAVKDLLHTSKDESTSEDQRVETLQKLITIIYELAEELGWIGFCQKLMNDLRDQFIAGSGIKIDFFENREIEKTLSEIEQATIIDR